jgi:hypothetical protein
MKIKNFGAAKGTIKKSPKTVLGMGEDIWK